MHTTILNIPSYNIAFISLFDKVAKSKSFIWIWMFEFAFLKFFTSNSSLIYSKEILIKRKMQLLLQSSNSIYYICLVECRAFMTVYISNRSWTRLLIFEHKANGFNIINTVGHITLRSTELTYLCYVSLILFALTTTKTINQ